MEMSSGVHEKEMVERVEKKRRAPPNRRCLPKCCGGFNPRDALVRMGAEDWLFLAMLGIIMAFLSYFMDFCIEKLQYLHVLVYERAAVGGTPAQFFAWVVYTVVLVLFATSFCHYVGPQAIGSGIPEVKTSMRGVVLKECFTFRTLIAKMVGLCVGMGSGMPIGKEGPFVHVGAIVATQLSKLVKTFKGIFGNESRSSEMLAAGCAVGISSTFGAPFGGVLFSIEVTSAFFAIRNYWRGLFCACCGALVFRLLAVAANKEVTVASFHKTFFSREAPYYPEELVVFAMLGVVCGCGGALFVYTHRSIVLFLRKNRFAKAMMQKSRYIYPLLVSLTISALNFPLGFGQFSAFHLTYRQAIDHFFVNFSWNESPDATDAHAEIVRYWTSEHTNIFINLTLYCVSAFILTALANTIPLPAGISIPTFVIGASFGRLTGESMAAWFPVGLRGGPMKIIPGGYAVVGGAAFTGAVAHSVSVAVIVYELSGQLNFLLPTMVAVLIANAVASYLQPSIYDSLIRVKHLPYLPEIVPMSSAAHQTHVDDIMVRDVKFVTKECSYRELRELLASMPRMRAFPLVDKKESMILLGSVPKVELEKLLDRQLGDNARKYEALKRQRHKNALGYKANAGSTNSIHDIHFPRVDSAKDLRPVLARRVNSVQFTEINGTQMKRTQSLQHMSEKKINPNAKQRSRKASGNSHNFTMHNIGNQFLHILFSNKSRSSSGKSGGYDLLEAERIVWESERLSQLLDFTNVQVDPAPFQLVEKTSLSKVHSLFSLLGLNRAYVTSLGKLIGVVALREVRHALEHVQSGFPTATKAKTREAAEVPLLAVPEQVTDDDDEEEDSDEEIDNPNEPPLTIVDSECMQLEALDPELDQEQQREINMEDSAPSKVHFINLYHESRSSSEDLDKDDDDNAKQIDETL